LFRFIYCKYQRSCDKKSNAGDSRAIISTNGIAEALSCDHKPTDKIELDRIKKAGCHVECGRVNGMLALSRALGDFEYKNCRELPPEEQAVTGKIQVFIRVYIKEGIK
jgi:protein phosphatase 2C family protein 2/3